MFVGERFKFNGFKCTGSIWDESDPAWIRMWGILSKDYDGQIYFSEEEQTEAKIACLRFTMWSYDRNMANIAIIAERKSIARYA